MAARIPVLLTKTPYEVIVGHDILSRSGEFIRQCLDSSKGILVTDSNVGPLYAETVRESFEKAGITTLVVTIPAGETSKSLTQTEAVCEAMVEAGLDRGAFVAGLGGGVVGDLAGFVASIYYRGVPHVQIPTSIVAQVDSAIGGKTGVNSRTGKNLIGSFHQPSLVIADPSVLATLPKREFNEGVAEIIKHAAIRDVAMFDALAHLHENDLSSLIARNVKIKALIVAEDEFEKLGIRALLNFGHTVGHAVESAAGYGRYLHGEAVSLGLAAALAISVKKAGLPKSDAEIVLNALRAFNLPTTLPSDLSTPSLMAALQRDKKFENGAIRYVLTESLGSAFVSKDVTEDDIREAIEGLRE